MGQKFDKSKATAFPDIETYFLKYAPYLQYIKIISIVIIYNIFLFLLLFR